MAEFILKDRYGKDRTFDKEAIFVQGADGELMQFTHGAGNPNIESLTITENGTYTAPEGVDGFNPVVVAVPAPEIKLQDKSITENGEYTADSGFDALAKVIVNVASSGKNVEFYRISQYPAGSKLFFDAKYGVPDVIFMMAESDYADKSYPNGLVYALLQKVGCGVLPRNEYYAKVVNGELTGLSLSGSQGGLGGENSHVVNEFTDTYMTFKDNMYLVNKRTSYIVYGISGLVE